MKEHSSPQAFRFLNLPLELCTRIYELYFAGNQRNAPHDIEVLTLKQYYPPRAITQVNRQCREDSLGLFDSEAKRFTEAHALHIRIGLEATDEGWREYLLRYSCDIPRCSIAQIQIRVEGVKLDDYGEKTLVLEAWVSPMSLNNCAWTAWVEGGSVYTQQRQEWTSVAVSREACAFDGCVRRCRHNQARAAWHL